MWPLTSASSSNVQAARSASRPARRSVRFLLGEDLLDELHLLIHPVVVGTGQRLFDGVTGPASFDVIEATRFTTGVMSMRLTPRGAERSASALEAHQRSVPGPALV